MAAEPIQACGTATMSLELIQIIEDGQDQGRVMDHILRKASFRTNVAFDGPTGIQDIWRLRPALVLLDWLVPGMTGKEICHRLRHDPQTRSIGILVVTSMTSEDHKVAPLEGGADDVLTKPFSPRELVARVKAVLRRLAGAAPAPDDDVEDLVLHEVQYRVSFRGAETLLTQVEWTILLRLAKAAGRVVPQEEIRAALWGDDGLSHDRELDQLMEGLNRKLRVGLQSSHDVIGSVTGAGYRVTRGSQHLRLSA